MACQPQCVEWNLGVIPHSSFLVPAFDFLALVPVNCDMTTWLANQLAIVRIIL